MKNTTDDNVLAFQFTNALDTLRRDCILRALRTLTLQNYSTRAFRRRLEIGCENATAAGRVLQQSLAFPKIVHLAQLVSRSVLCTKDFRDRVPREGTGNIGVAQAWLAPTWRQRP